VLPDLTSIALFLRAVKLHSLSRAAEESHLSVSAASRRLSLLEHHFQVALLDRTPGGVVPTAAGEALAQHALTVLKAVDAMQADLSDYANGAIGRVRLYANTSAMSQALPGQLASWARQYPQIKLEIRELRSRAIVQAVREGLCDVGVVTTAAPGDDGLRFEPYCADRLCLIVPQAHPVRGPRARFADLIVHDFVGLDNSSAISQTLADAALAAGAPLRLRVQVQSFEAVCRLIAAGQGIGVLPAGAVQAFRHDMALRFVDLDDDWADRRMYVCVRAGPLASPSARLVEHLLQPPADAA
jgi:DNA-binding transcriptional LysR family regulator